ncbi:MAG: hypothetical protein Q8K60_09335, partial [Parachlamydiaceae bacterium]|nr:hypothetical protein [Parachlamydiaceae bacterium]
MTNRHTLSAVVIFFYLIPFLLLSYYSVKLMSADKSWGILSLGLLLIVSCTLALILILYYWEQATIASADHSVHSLLQYPTDLNEEKIIKVTSIEPSLTFPLSTNDDQKIELR